MAPSSAHPYKPSGVQRAYYRIPQDLFQRGWDEKTLLVALYLMGCPSRTTEGLFWLPIGSIPAALKWPFEDVTQPFTNLVKEGFVKYDDHYDIVFLCEALQLQSTANEGVATHAIGLLKKLPPTPLFDDMLVVAEVFDPRLAAAMLREMPKRFAKRSA